MGLILVCALLSLGGTAALVIKNISVGPMMILYGVLNFIGGTIALIVAYFLFLLICSLFVNLKKDIKTYSKFWRFNLIVAVEFLKVVLNVKIETVGFEKLPEGPVLLVHNHRHMFDPIFNIIALKKKYKLGYVAKKSIYDKAPLIPQALHKVGGLPIDSKSVKGSLKTIIRASEIVKGGVISMGIFPEGRRWYDGKLHEFHQGVFLIAQKAEVPVVVITIDDTRKINKNAPFKRTTITLNCVGVISKEEVQTLRVNEISEKAFNMMSTTIEVYKEEEVENNG